MTTDVVLNKDVTITTVDDHLLVDLPLENDLNGKVSGAISFARSTVGTYLDKDDGLIKTAAINAARFEANGLLIESQSTNLITYSDDFTAIDWAKTNITASSTLNSSPVDGKAWGRIESSTSGGPSLREIGQTSIATTQPRVTFQGLFRKDQVDNLIFTFDSPAGVGGRVRLNLTDLETEFNPNGDSLNGVIRSEFVSDYVKMSLSFDAGVGAVDVNVWLQNIKTLSFGSTLDIGDGLELIALGLEESDFPTSYIKTIGGPVTRDSDIFSIQDFSSAFNQSQGAVFANFSTFDVEPFSRLLQLDDGSNNNKISMLQNGSGDFKAEVTSGGFTTVNGGVLTSAPDSDYAISYTADNVSVYGNGLLLLNDTSVDIPLVSAIGVMSTSFGASQCSGHVRNIKIFDIALDSTQIQGPSANEITETLKPYYDFEWTAEGDLPTAETLDTAILMSIFEEARATPAEVPDSPNRRGWVGNESTPGFEQGSKAWQFEQERISGSTLAELGVVIRNSLQWLIDDEIAVNVEVEQPRLQNGYVCVYINLGRDGSPVDRRFFQLWENTGNF